MNIEGRRLPFIDEAKIVVEGGRGGDGCISFLHEKYKPFGGPDGGDGGNGGDVVLVAKEGVFTLWEVLRHPHYKAENGAGGKGKRRHGADGASLYVNVPCGTKVFNEEGECVAELLEEGASFVAAKGGRGGRGNAHFCSSRMQAPRFAERGERGQRHTLFLRLSLLAHVGIIGYPNVGKSTLLSAMTGASPLIAPYPFTTKVPHLGVIKDEASLFIFAEIPGIIKDAHKGAGLGTRFLRHTKRTRLLLHVLDITSEDPLRDYLSVKEEMRLFDEELSRKPEIVVVNKMDAPDASQKYKVIRRKLLCHNKNVLPISALKKRGIKRIISLVQKLLPQKEEERKEQIVKHYKYRPLFQIKKEGNVFIIKGEGIERMVDMFDFSESSLPFWHRWVKRMGIDEALRKAGARNGDRVRIKDKEFIYNA